MQWLSEKRRATHLDLKRKLIDLKLISKRSENLNVFHDTFKILPKDLNLETWVLKVDLYKPLLEDYECIVKILIAYCEAHKNSNNSLSIKICMEMLVWFKENCEELGSASKAHNISNKYIDRLRNRNTFCRSLIVFEKEDLSACFVIAIELVIKTIEKMINKVEILMFEQSLCNTLNANIESIHETITRANDLFQYLSQSQTKQFHHEQAKASLSLEREDVKRRLYRNITLIEGIVDFNENVCQTVKNLKSLLFRLIDIQVILQKGMTLADQPEGRLILSWCYKPLQNLILISMKLQEDTTHNMKDLNHYLYHFSQKGYENLLDTLYALIGEATTICSLPLMAPGIDVPPELWHYEQTEYLNELCKIVIELPDQANANHEQLEFISQRARRSTIILDDFQYNSLQNEKMSFDITSLAWSTHKNFRIDKSAMQIILTYLKHYSNITKINFQNSKIDLDAFSDLIDYIIDSEPRFRKLNLTGCESLFRGKIYKKQNETGRWMSAAMFLSKLLNTKRSGLRALSVSHCQLSTKDALALMNALIKNIDLEILSIGFNPSIGDKGAVPLFNALVRHPNLRKLNVNATGMTTPGAHALCQLARNNSTLIEVVMDENPIEHQDGMPLLNLDAVLVTSMSHYKAELTDHLRKNRQNDTWAHVRYSDLLIRMNREPMSRYHGRLFHNPMPSNSAVMSNKEELEPLENALSVSEFDF